MASPVILDSRGRRMLKTRADPPRPLDVVPESERKTWMQDVNADTLFHHCGHWFEIVGFSKGAGGGIVCRWRGPTKQKKRSRGKTPGK